MSAKSDKWDIEWDSSVAEAKRAYPDHFDNRKSELYWAVVGEMRFLCANKDHPLFGNSNLPMLTFAKHAMRLCIEAV